MGLRSFRLPRFLSGSQEYLELEKGDNDGSENSYLETSSRQNIGYKPSFIISSILNVFLGATLLTLSSFNISTWQESDSKEHIRETSSFSPLIDKLPLTSSLKMINGSFMSETNPPDIFRDLPSKSVDAAWHPIAKPTWITITESEARLLGKDPSVLVKAPEDWGYGNSKYIAMMDLNHQLHCVDQLRRAAFRDEYPLSPVRMDFQKEHWMHCVHILYQNVMCTGSTELITYNWRETQRFPVPDFDVDKKCKNTEVLLEFQEREKIVGMDELREEMEKPADAVTLPLPSRLKAFLEAHDK